VPRLQLRSELHFNVPSKMADLADTLGVTPAPSPRRINARCEIRHVGSYEP
jgi:hypothetical protein